MVQRLAFRVFFLCLKISELLQKAFLDSMPLSNSSVLFGPYCEYALAQVARLIKVHENTVQQQFKMFKIYVLMYLAL